MPELTPEKIAELKRLLKEVNHPPREAHLVRVRSILDALPALIKAAEERDHARLEYSALIERGEAYRVAGKKQRERAEKAERELRATCEALSSKQDHPNPIECAAQIRGEVARLKRDSRVLRSLRERLKREQDGNHGPEFLIVEEWLEKAEARAAEEGE
jgi:hypothetical protein